MTNFSKFRDVISHLLQHDHRSVAYMLSMTSTPPSPLDTDIVASALSALQELSMLEDESSRKASAYIAALLWEYRDENLPGLRDHLILALSRCGFSPTSTMLDKNFDRALLQYDGIGSFFGEMSIALNQLRSQVIVRDKEYILTEFQKSLWDAIDNNSIVGVSAPTSAGKSFLIQLKILDLLLKHQGQFVYVVPTLSLVSQVSNDLRVLLSQFDISNYEITNTYSDKYQQAKALYVLTQERAISAFSQDRKPFGAVTGLIVDEIQNIERVADHDQSRARILLDMIHEFREVGLPLKTIISGPRLINIENTASKLFGASAAGLDTTCSPVISITYSIAKHKENYVLNQRSDILPEVFSVSISKDYIVHGYSKKRYTDEYYSYLHEFISSLPRDHINILFSPTSVQAAKTAVEIAGRTDQGAVNDLLISLGRYVTETVCEEYNLVKTLNKGIAYHHGKMPNHVRRCIEKAASMELLQTIACTTTLMQGVNLPANNVIIRNPNLYINKKKDSVELTFYEIANLRGRAGRLLKDLIGRAFVLDESGFNENVNEDGEQQSLFGEASKEIETGYAGAYLAHETEILEALENSSEIDPKADFGFLVTYIRQTLLRYSNNSFNKLRSVGISIEKSFLRQIENDLGDLSIPKDICLQNRYWDPLDLNRLYADFIDGNIDKLPGTPFDPKYKQRIFDLLRYMHSEFPNYYVRYRGTPRSISQERKFQHVLSKCSQQWACEVPLRKLIPDSFKDPPEKVDDAIKTVQNTVAFGLPMLLKPLASFDQTDNSLLQMIELGAYQPKTRRLIEMGIAREPAIDLSERYLSDIVASDDDPAAMDLQIERSLKAQYSSIDFWTRVQIEGIIPMGDSVS